MGCFLKESDVIIMPKSCCVNGCTNNKLKNPDLNFYTFPKDSERRARWIAKISRALVIEKDGKKIVHRGKLWKPSCSSYVCSDHFETGRVYCCSLFKVVHLLFYY